jgi:hypothetical protein
VGGLIGGLLGAALGWLVGAWAVRRWRGLAGVPRRTVSILAAAGAVGLAPAVVLTLARLAGGHAQLSRPQIPLWTGIGEPGLRTVAAVAAFSLLAALVTVAFARSRQPAEPAG